MNATAAVLEMPKPAKKEKSSKNRDSAVLPTPKQDTRYHLRQAAMLALDQGLSYRDSIDLFRVFLLDTALKQKRGVKKDAAALLGITRDHVREFHKRGKDLF
jgi:DNA-binding NtrC family response regulator